MIPLVYAWPLAVFCAVVALSGARMALSPEREAQARRRTLSRRLKNNAAERLPSFPAAAERWCDPETIRRGGVMRVGAGLAGIAMLLPTLARVYIP